jgi:mevalonate kinase
MAQLSKEEIIMTSNDNSITLTTHRILQKTSEINKEILLRDIVSQEVIKKRHRYYKILSLLFGIPTTILALLYITKSDPFETTIDTMFDRSNGNGASAISIVLAILTFISVYLLLTTSEKYLRISGRFNEIEFSLKDLSNSSRNKFLNRLTIESDNRKRED